MVEILGLCLVNLALYWAQDSWPCHSMGTVAGMLAQPKESFPSAHTGKDDPISHHGHTAHQGSTLELNLLLGDTDRPSLIK